MSSFEFRQHMNRLRDELSELEARAGISEHAAKIDEGCFIPYGIDGEGDDLPRNQLSENYFDTEFDHRRDGIRDLYFRISDTDLRKALIEKTRLIDCTLRERSIEDKATAINSMENTQKAFGNPKWTIPILIILVAIGWGIYEGGWKGVLIVAGGVTYSYLQRKDSINRLKFELEQVKDSVAFERQNTEEWEVKPEYFSLQEALTGERDVALDSVSAGYLRALIRKEHVQ